MVEIGRLCRWRYENCLAIPLVETRASRLDVPAASSFQDIAINDVMLTILIFILSRLWRWGVRASQNWGCAAFFGTIVYGSRKSFLYFISIKG